MEKLGVIGGLGPMATAFFMKMVVEMTDAETDQEHIEMIIYNSPGIPDRTRYILGESSEDPFPKMLEIGKKLKEQEVGLIAVPCITASYFYQKLSNELSVKMINIIEELFHYLTKRGFRKIGLMATSGTIESGLFQNVFETRGCSMIVPSEQRQKDMMHVIYENVKANCPVDMQRFEAVSAELREAGAEVIILGCTELSVVRQTCKIGAGYLDALQLMAKCAVEACGKLRAKYRELVTPNYEM